MTPMHVPTALVQGLGVVAAVLLVCLLLAVVTACRVRVERRREASAPAPQPRPFVPAQRTGVER